MLLSLPVIIQVILIISLMGSPQDPPVSAVIPRENMVLPTQMVTFTGIGRVKREGITVTGISAIIITIH